MVWSGAFFAFCQGVNKPRVAQIAYMRGETGNESQISNFFFSALLSLLPLLFLTNVASTSNRCDHLLDELNNLRKKFGPRCNEEITWLETSLVRLNRGQGLGFTIGGIVIVPLRVWPSPLMRRSSCSPNGLVSENDGMLI